MSSGTEPALQGRAGLLVWPALILLGCSGGDPHDGDAADAGLECPQGMCWVDSPCGNGAVCLLNVDHLVKVWRTYGCEEVCPDACCGGQGCERTLESCGEGSVCAYPQADPLTFLLWHQFAPGDAASCVARDQACGGPEGLACGPGQYCELVGTLCPYFAADEGPCVGSDSGYSIDFCAYGEAGGLGTCRPLAAPGDCAGEAPDPVCSCDGTTFENDCLRRVVGAPIRRPGPC